VVVGRVTVIVDPGGLDVVGLVIVEVDQVIVGVDGVLVVSHWPPRQDVYVEPGGGLDVVGLVTVDVDHVMVGVERVLVVSQGPPPRQDV
jgi:hypothetical protein